MSLTFPILGDYRVSSPFGRRQSPGGIGSTNHKGIDFAAPMGTPVVAPISGKVTFAGVAGGYGNQVQLRGDDGNLYSFAHLQGFNVGKGATVQAGQQLGAVGSTGRSTGPHLHFEIKDRAGNVINPSGLLAGAKQAAKGALARGTEAAKSGLRTALETYVPGGAAVASVTDGLGLTSECGYICQFQNWLKETGFVQRLALAVFAFILLFAAFYLMKGDTLDRMLPSKATA